jgi:hypothetical protein
MMLRAAEETTVSTPAMKNSSSPIRARSEGEYQYNSDDERSQNSGANDENESTEGDDEGEDDLSGPELRRSEP